MTHKKTTAPLDRKIAELRAAWETARKTANLNPTAENRARAQAAWAALDAASPRRTKSAGFASRAGKRQAAERRSRAHATKNKTATQLDREIATALAGPKGTDTDDGVFYLTDTKEQPLRPEFSKFSSRAAAKRAAMKLVREGVNPRVEVWHWWRGGHYMQGLASDEGWSDV